MATSVTLVWECFASLVAARTEFATRPCIYVQADREGRAVRVGKASMGLVARYRGGTGYALDAAMHGSGNRVFVAAVDQSLCELVEATLIQEHKASLPYNNQAPSPDAPIRVVHAGIAPRFGGRE